MAAAKIPSTRTVGGTLTVSDPNIAAPYKASQPAARTGPAPAPVGTPTVNAGVPARGGTAPTAGRQVFTGDAPRLLRDLAWRKTQGEGAPGSEYFGELDKYNTPGSFWTEGNTDKFLTGDTDAYAKWAAGAAPTVGEYQDATSIAEIDAAKRNALAGEAQYGLDISQLRQNFAEAINTLNKSKGKSLGSLSDSMADRGLTNSGVFLKSTDDTNDRFQDMETSQTRAKTQQEAQLEGQRANLANTLSQAIGNANTSAFQRALTSWSDRQKAALATATQRLRDSGLM